MGHQQPVKTQPITGRNPKNTLINLTTQMPIIVRKRVWDRDAYRTVKNVIDVKDKLTFKVLLANRWSPSPEVGGSNNTKKRGE
jgi:hypothetical protein